jgi:hypothetical protein
MTEAHRKSGPHLRAPHTACPLQGAHEAVEAPASLGSSPFIACGLLGASALTLLDEPHWIRCGGTIRRHPAA